jgi:hypothetical protein
LREPKLANSEVAAPEEKCQAYCNGKCTTFVFFGFTENGAQALKQAAVLHEVYDF